MSTKSTVDYEGKGPNGFHLYTDFCFPGKIFLAAGADVIRFEASPEEIVVEITAELWERIRKHEFPESAKENQ